MILSRYNFLKNEAYSLHAEYFSSDKSFYSDLFSSLSLFNSLAINDGFKNRFSFGDLTHFDGLSVDEFLFITNKFYLLPGSKVISDSEPLKNDLSKGRWFYAGHLMSIDPRKIILRTHDDTYAFGPQVSYKSIPSSLFQEKSLESLLYINAIK
jgi:hypothetical protein